MTANRGPWILDEKAAYIALTLMEGVGPVTVGALVKALGSARAIFECAPGALSGADGVNRLAAARLAEQRGRIDPRPEMERAFEEGIGILTPADPEYPKQLARIYDPPLALYVRGRLESGDNRALGVVGTRHASMYGRETAERLSRGLAQAGFSVVSGLARGIDTAAHRGALKAGGRTLAVIGSGLDFLYPPENKELAGEIAAGHGAVLSEFPLARKPDKATFPMRNRVISGLSMGVLVVEANLTSGAFHTVNQALDQGRSVFAVPGRIDSPGARGPHQLIKSGARLVEDVDDILQEFEFLIPPGIGNRKRAEEAPPRPPLLPDEARIAGALEEEGEMDLDQLCRLAGLGAARVGALLIGLEMKRVVRMLPGRRVELARNAVCETGGRGRQGV